VSLDQNPESKRMTSSPVAPARRTRATSSAIKRLAPRAEPAGPRRSRAWSTSPVSARVATPVIAEHPGVAITGPFLGLAGHFTDGRVEVDHEARCTGTHPERPGSTNGLAENRVELADVP